MFKNSVQNFCSNDEALEEFGDSQGKYKLNKNWKVFIIDMLKIIL